FNNFLHNILKITSSEVIWQRFGTHPQFVTSFNTDISNVT
ncbi:unnamed protein product, partial [Acanthoscelides obtectus]